MGKFLKLHWVFFCGLIFIVSRLIMLYQYDLANYILFHHHSSFFASMCKWDCKWYLTIINNGYDLHVRKHPRVWNGLANWAFFPLYPYSVKLLVALTGASALVTGVLLNQAFILLALCLFYLYLKLFVDEFNSRFGVILLAFSPFSIYFASLYTEALFLLLSLAAFYFMRTKRLWLSAICGGLLSATRPVGVMFSLVYFYARVKQSGIRVGILISCLLTVSGLLGYMLYLHFHTGDFLAFQHIQKGWGRKGLDTQHLGSQVWRMLSDFHNSIIFLFSVAISLYLLAKKYIEEAMFNLFCILPGVLTGAMLSEGRFSGTLFTFYFGLVLLARNSNSLKIILAVVFFLFYVSYFLYWMAHASFLI
ncbi:MAG: mannosyltransferase family protein [Burkholderiales bacterium]